MKEISVEELKLNPSTLIGKEWALLTAGNKDGYNTMTVSWGQMGDLWNKPTTVVYIRPQRYTKEFVDKSDYYTLSFLPDGHREALSYLGSHSGRDEDKLAKTDLTGTATDDYAYIEQAKLVLVCKKLYRQPMTPDSFVDKSLIEKCYAAGDFHEMYVGEIVKVLVSEQLMKRAVVIGCSGSGKSVFSRKLRDATGLSLYYLDMIWHKPDGTNISREEFDKQLDSIISRDSWIIDGNYQRTLETRIKACDTVFLFDLPTEICIEGALSRIGKKREDMPWFENELDPEFRQWIESFRANQLPEVYRLLEKYKNNREIVVFRTREQADKFIEKLV